MKNKMKKIIMDSFEQKEQRKPIYIRDQLKRLYEEEEWNVIFIFPEEGQGFSYSFGVYSSTLCCSYQGRAIIITQNKLTSKESKNDSVDNKNYIEQLEKNKKDLNEQIFALKIKLNEAQATIYQKNSTLEELKSKIKEEKDKVESFKKIIDDKGKQINNLEKKIKENNPNNTFCTRDQILALNFMSMDQTLHFAVPCVKKDLFVDVEKKIYDKYPDYRETNNTFLAQGKAILRFKTIEENKLESGINLVMTQIKNN